MEIPQINRNGAVGEFEAFRQPRRSTDDLLAAAFAETQTNGKPHVSRVSKTLPVGKSFLRLVRYVHGSRELRNDGLAVTANFVCDPVFAECQAFFGVINARGRPAVILDVISRDGAPEIVSVAVGRGPHHGLNEFMLDVLNYLDIPASSRSGAVAEFMDKFSLGYDTETLGWTRRVTVKYVAVTMERCCLATRPPLMESMDILLPIDCDHDLGALQREDYKSACDHYISMALEKTHAKDRDAGWPESSSWTCRSDPHFVRIVDPDMVEALEMQVAHETKP